MTDPRLEDHVVGLELQLVELVEEQQRAVVQGRADDAARLGSQIEALQSELAATAERLTTEAPATVNGSARAEVAAPSAGELVDQA